MYWLWLFLVLCNSNFERYKLGKVSAIQPYDFVIGLIESEIERDLTQRAAVGEGQTESAAVSDCEDDFDDENEELDDEESEDIDEEQDESEEQCSGESNDSSDDESEELDDEASEDIDEEQGESEDQVMSMGM